MQDRLNLASWGLSDMQQKRMTELMSAVMSSRRHEGPDDMEVQEIEPTIPGKKQTKY